MPFVRTFIFDGISFLQHIRGNMKYVRFVYMLHMTNIIREGCQLRVYLNTHPFAVLVPIPGFAAGYFFI